MRVSYFLRMILILLSLGLFSCDLIDKADDVSFDVEQTVTFNINETASNPTGKNYTDTKTLNVANDPDITEYASKIKEFKVKKVTYTIIFSSVPGGGVTFNNGKITTSTGKTIATSGSVSLNNFDEHNLTTDNAGLEALASSLLSKKQEQITLSGFLTQTPVAFSVDFTFYLTVTADALK